MSNQPYIVNPEAVGDPEQTPLVQVPDALAALLERTRCPECGLINHCHEATCSRADDQQHDRAHAQEEER